MKRTLILLSAVLVLAAGCCKTPDKIIKTPVPARPAGQTDVLGLTAAPIETVHIGVVGLGMRGSEAVNRLAQIPGAEITALCDLLPDRVASSQEILARRGKPAAKGTYSGEQESWRGLCEQADVDLVYICTDWLNHSPIAMCPRHGRDLGPDQPVGEDPPALHDARELHL